MKSKNNDIQIEDGVDGKFIIKGIGKIYQQTWIDTYSNMGFAKLYLNKTQTVAADFLNSKVLSFFDEHRISVLRVLTDNGR